jgi:hypothetical protein
MNLSGPSTDFFLIRVLGRTVVMFELSLLPNKIAFGQIQRRLATKCGVYPIPKRFFVDVMSGANSTSDGLHLSNTGTRRMAALVVRALSPVLKSSNKMPGFHWPYSRVTLHLRTGTPIQLRRVVVRFLS